MVLASSAEIGFGERLCVAIRQLEGEFLRVDFVSSVVRRQDCRITAGKSQ